MWGSSLIVVVVLGGVILCVQVPYASRRRWGYSAAWMAGWRLRSTAEPGEMRDLPMTTFATRPWISSGRNRSSVGDTFFYIFRDLPLYSSSSSYSLCLMSRVTDTLAPSGGVGNLDVRCSELCDH